MAPTTRSNTVLQAKRFKQMSPTVPSETSSVQKEYEDMFNAELTCCICQELFVQPTTLSCSHTFCHYCVEEWFRKRKNHCKECPICRASVTVQIRQLVIESLIEKIVLKMDSELKESRTKLVEERKKLFVPPLKESAPTIPALSFLNHSGSFSDSDSEWSNNSSDFGEFMPPWAFPGTINFLDPIHHDQSFNTDNEDEDDEDGDDESGDSDETDIINHESESEEEQNDDDEEDDNNDDDEDIDEASSLSGSGHDPDLDTIFESVDDCDLESVSSCFDIGSLESMSDNDINITGINEDDITDDESSSSDMDSDESD